MNPTNSTEHYRQGLEYRREGKWDLARECLLKAALLMIRQSGHGIVAQRRIEVALQLRELARDCQRKAEQQAFCEQVVRKWINTISHDLCIAPPAITISTEIVGRYGRAGGMYDYSNHRVTIPAIYADERVIVYVLCHELRHAFNHYNRIPQTEPDCDNYAKEFVGRIRAPQDGVYRGAIHFTTIVGDKAE